MDFFVLYTEEIISFFSWFSKIMGIYTTENIWWFTNGVSHRLLSACDRVYNSAYLVRSLWKQRDIETAFGIMHPGCLNYGVRLYTISYGCVFAGFYQPEPGIIHLKGRSYAVWLYDISWTGSEYGVSMTFLSTVYALNMVYNFIFIDKDGFGHLKGISRWCGLGALLVSKLY